MKKILFLIILSAFSLFGQSKKSKIISEIDKILKIQVESWNEGNLEKFVSYYQDSDSMKFIGKEKITYGQKN